ncbi:retrovirus-related Pol polyprotein from transposon TNT 1-94 [Trichonephila clavipes]|nr:retrovirus-related Pol polyprotein from transposon TNT 1-94 [Trichonephila clavipes]
MMERKVWDLVDHPDNIKILENRWVYTIKYDENNKIVRYKARLVARGNTQLRGESFDEVFQEYQLELSKVKSLKLRCYSDSDFATNRNDQVSMGGFITFIDETPISSRTFKQKSVSLSTMEAEYVSLTEAAKEFIWLKNNVSSIHGKLDGLFSKDRISFGGAPVSSRTIRRCLSEGHLGSWRPLRVLPLTPTHRRLRLEWCRARGNWTAAEWNQVVFSDESSFNLSSDDNRVRVW